MKKYVLFLFSFVFLISCAKEESTMDMAYEQEVLDSDTAATRGSKVDVCHKGKITKVNINAVPPHQGHGDAVDMDGDGYFDIDNPCSETDCDDNDPNVNVTVCESTTYDNENLSAGNLNGQDGWITKGWINDTPDGYTSEVGTVQNGSSGITFSLGGSGVGTSGSRLEDGNWEMPDNNACDESAFFEFEANISLFGVLVGPGFDKDSDGTIDIFRGNNQETPVYFWLSAASSPTWGLKLVPSGGYYAATTVPVSVIGGLGDHVKIKVVIDYQANSGAGSASAFYQNLTNGDTVYQPINGLQDIALTLDFNATDHNNPSLWNGVTYHFEGAGNELDNFTFSNCN